MFKQSKMDKSKQTSQISDSDSSYASKTGSSMKKEKKSDTAEKEEVEKTENLSDVNIIPEPVQTEKHVNTEPDEDCDLTLPENIEKRFEKLRGKNVLQAKEISLKVAKNVPTPNSSNDQVVTDAKISQITIKQNVADFYQNTKIKSVDDYQNSTKLLYSNAKITYTKVVEITKDLFNMSEDYSLAHCVAEDLNMGSGIAVQFSVQFKNYGELYNQRQREGGLAILSFPPRFIYYLVTKKYSNGKPTLCTLWNSLVKMQKHVQENSIKQVAMPRIGCGLDRLEWSVVKLMIEDIFKDTDVLITVCNFQQKKGAAPRPLLKCRIVNVYYPIVQIEAGTMIIYLGSEDGFVNSAMEKLDKKFGVLADYRRGPRTLGKVVKTDAFNGDFVIFGFIVKKLFDGDIDYANVEKCTQEVNKFNEKFGKHGYGYLGIEVFEDPLNEDMMFYKVLNILRSIVRQVDVYVCYPKDLIHLMPRKRNDF